MPARTLRVAFVLGEPTPYRIPHLRALAAREELDITVVYAAATVQRRTWQVEHAEAVYLSGPMLPLSRVLHHDYALTPGIWRLLARGGFDLVVVGGWSLMATQLAILWCRLRRVPYLLMSDNHLLEPRPLWVRAVKRLVLPRIVPQAAGWLVPGSLAKHHIVFYGAKPDRVLTFPLTIDVGRWARLCEAARPERDSFRARYGVVHDDVLVLQVGRLVAHKAVDVLLRGASGARQLGANVHVLVVGAGPDERSLRELAASLDVPVSFAGELDTNSLPAAYAAADVFALVSARETWGVVVNEAAAAGLPLVLSSGVGAAADLLEAGQNGERVPVGDVGALAEALARLADDPELRRRYGERSRELVSGWGYERSVDEFVRLAGQVAR
jgi:glycosyltransferase involved in cell wall biosynthesis